MDVDTITKLIGNLGFPIFVAVWMLWRDNQKMDRLTEVIQQMTDVISKCNAFQKPLQ